LGSETDEDEGVGMYVPPVGKVLSASEEGGTTGLFEGGGVMKFETFLLLLYIQEDLEDDWYRPLLTPELLVMSELSAL